MQVYAKASVEFKLNFEINSIVYRTAKVISLKSEVDLKGENKINVNKKTNVRSHVGIYTLLWYI